MSIARRLDETLRRIPGSEYIRTGVLSHLSLHQPEDWRLGQDLALAELRMHRVTEGLRELERGRLLSEKRTNRSFRKTSGPASELPPANQTLNASHRPQDDNCLKIAVQACLFRRRGRTLDRKEKA